MPITTGEMRDLIVQELNGGPALTQVIATYWRFNDPYARAPVVQYLRTRLMAIDWCLGRMDEEIAAPQAAVPEQGDLPSRAQLRRANLLSLRTSTVTDLTNIGASGSAGPVMGLLTTTAPIPSPAGWPMLLPWPPDANDTAYWGDPNKQFAPVVPP